MEQETGRGLSGARAHHQDRTGIRMQQHRDVRGERLVIALILALPPAIDLELEPVAATDHREIRGEPLAVVHQDLALIGEEVGGKPGTRELGKGGPHEQRADDRGDPPPARSFLVEQRPGDEAGAEAEAGDAHQGRLESQRRKRQEAHRQRSGDPAQRVERRQAPHAEAGEPRIGGQHAHGQREHGPRKDGGRHQQQGVGDESAAEVVPDRGRDHHQRQHQQAVSHLEHPEAEGPCARAIEAGREDDAPDHDPD